MIKTTLSLPLDGDYSILQRVLDGTLTIDSIDEFKDILAVFPDDPLLHRKYADRLMEKGYLDQAVDAYARTAELFIDNAMNLQAVVAKILQWTLQKPVHSQGAAFQAKLYDKGSKHTPLQRFWARMSYPELVAVMRRLVRVRLSTGEKIMTVDDPADDVYFIVSGTLAEILSPDCQSEAARAGIDTEPVFLGPNDIFGDIFPLDHPTRSNKEIVAVSETELVRISKKILFNTCLKFPNIEQLLMEIHKPQKSSTCDRSWQTVRRTTRYGVQTKVDIQPSRSVDDIVDSGWRYLGIAVDISMGGACVDLGLTPTHAYHAPYKGQTVDLQMDLADGTVKLKLSAKIVWLRIDNTDTGSVMMVGLRFDPLVPSKRKLLAEYCAGGIDEQNPP
jgi:CRP-like cAMP-binding protein